MNVKIGTCGRAVPFLGIFVSNKEYINGFFVAVWFSLDLRFLHQQLKSGGGLDLLTLSICLPLKEALFFLILLFIYV
jgi:hypothetical protein